MNADLLREDRLAFWDRLIRGVQVPPAECDDLLTQLAVNADPEEQAGCILLLASVGIANEANRAMRRNLRAALKYWFSHTGTKESREAPGLHDVQEGGLESVIGLYLSWPEAMESVGGNPNDYSALKRLESLLRARCVEEWERRFGTPAPAEMSDRR